MMSINTYGIVTLKIDGVTSFSQLHVLDVKDVSKIRGSVYTRVAGNSDSLFKMMDSL